MSEQRRFRSDWFLHAFAAAKKKKVALSKKKLVSMFCLEFGSAKRTGLEILELFADQGVVKIKEDLVVVK